MLHRLVAACVCVVACASVSQAQSAWRADVSAAAFGEAWDLNEARETFAGLAVGLEREVGAGVAIRGEASVLRVRQAGDDAWQRGTLLLARWRARAPRLHPFVELGAGWAWAGVPVPPRGTRGNYLLVAGGGIEFPVTARLAARLNGRWHHVSNNGREGRHRNPDIQALGVLAGLAWAW